MMTDHQQSLSVLLLLPPSSSHSPSLPQLTAHHMCERGRGIGRGDEIEVNIKNTIAEANNSSNRICNKYRKEDNSRSRNFPFVFLQFNTLLFYFTKIK